jgi:TPR repeat protein
MADLELERLRTAAQDTLGGRVELLREAGSGGMGRVFEAIDRKDGRRLAIKLLHHRERDDLARFNREAEVLESLSHPAIVSYVAHGTTPEGDAYLAMEWLDGEALSLRLRRGRLAIDEALVIGRRVAEALAAAHARGVVHRDLKPSNVFLRDGRPDRAVLLDFGVARRIEEGAAVTRTGVVVGTPGYMAPEQVRGQRLDGRADLFGLGCMLYEALTGVSPFEAADIMSALAQLLLVEPRPLVELRPDAPPRLDGLIQCLLAKEAEARPESADQVAAELAAIADAVARGDVAALGRIEAPAPPRSKRRLFVAAGGAVAIAAVGIGAWQLRGDEERVTPAPVATSTPAPPAECTIETPGPCKALCDAGLADACLTFAQAELRRTPRDESQALALYTRACQLGSAAGCTDQAKTLGNIKYRASGREWIATMQDLLESACQRGNTAGCEQLAHEIEGGQVLNDDPRRPHELRVANCKNGSSASCFILGYAHRNGKSLPRDPELTASYYKRACELDPKSRYCKELRDWEMVTRQKPPEVPPICREDALTGCRPRCKKKDAAACFWLAAWQRSRSDAERLCAGGQSEACLLAAYLLADERVEQPPASWAPAYRRLLQAGCDRKERRACRALAADLLDDGGRLSRDDDASVRAFAAACRISPSGYGRECLDLTDLLLAGRGADDARAAAITTLEALCTPLTPAACEHLERLGTRSLSPGQRDPSQ